jgi:hypothetical protein
VFLIMMIVGLIMMFLSGMLFSIGEPTDSICGGAFWLLDLGFYFAFAPLFAKSWRIYKIFMRTQMSVLKITDMMLFVRLLAVLLVEIVSALLRWRFVSACSCALCWQMLLVIIHFVDPVKATTQIQSALPRDQLVTYCSPSRPELIGALGGIKASACSLPLQALICASGCVPRVFCSCSAPS